MTDLDVALESHDAFWWNRSLAQVASEFAGAVLYGWLTSVMTDHSRLLPARCGGKWSLVL